MIKVETDPVVAVVHQRLAERISGRWRRKPCPLLLQQVEDVCMRNVPWRWGGALVISDWRGGVIEAAVRLEGKACLPIVEASGAVGRDSGRQRYLNARDQCGRVEGECRYGQVDHEESVGLIQSGGLIGDGGECSSDCGERSIDCPATKKGKGTDEVGAARCLEMREAIEDGEALARRRKSVTWRLAQSSSWYGGYDEDQGEEMHGRYGCSRWKGVDGSLSCRRAFLYMCFALILARKMTDAIALALACGVMMYSHCAMLHWLLRRPKSPKPDHRFIQASFHVDRKMCFIQQQR